MIPKLAAFIEKVKTDGYQIGTGITPETKPPKNLFGPGSTDHEKEAARDGFVPSCCGSAENTKLLM